MSKIHRSRIISIRFGGEYPIIVWEEVDEPQTETPPPLQETMDFKEPERPNGETPEKEPPEILSDNQIEVLIKYGKFTMEQIAMMDYKEARIRCGNLVGEYRARKMHTEFKPTPIESFDMMHPDYRLGRPEPVIGKKKRGRPKKPHNMI